MPDAPITIAYQSENFTITIDNTHHTKSQSIFHKHTDQQQQIRYGQIQKDKKKKKKRQKQKINKAIRAIRPANQRIQKRERESY